MLSKDDQSGNNASECAVHFANTKKLQGIGVKIIMWSVEPTLLSASVGLPSILSNPSNRFLYNGFFLVAGSSGGR